MNRCYRSALRGNVVGMAAVGIIIGAAFSTIVKSLVDDIIMPAIGVLTGGVDFSDLFMTLGKGSYGSLAQARQAGAATSISAYSSTT
ncbi:MAG: MscL family protein [Methyloceanibacter sp.]